MKPRVMYIEYKGDALTGPGRIGRVRFSPTGKTLYYGEKSFRSLKGRGYKANFYDVETGERYWISGCKKSGEDALYAQEIEIDEDVREEYWISVRNRPADVRKRSFKSPGKYSKG